MPIGLNSLELQGFYKLPQTLFGKSVQANWRFLVKFIPTYQNDGFKEFGPMPIIQSWHVLNIAIPTYNFKKEIMMYGQIPRSFPVLNYEGFDITVTFEEDELGTISYFINWLQKNIIKSDGRYRGALRNRFGHIAVELQDKNGIPVVYYVFKNCYYLASDGVSLDYGSNESLKYNVTFSCDVMQTYYTKYNPVGLGVGTLQTSVSSVNNFVKKLRR